MREYRTAPISSELRRQIPTLSETMTAALKAVKVPKRENGDEQCPNNQKARAGTLDWFRYAEEVFLDDIDAGMTVQQWLGLMGAMQRWGLMQLGVMADPRDLRAAIVAETRAQCALDPRQLNAFDVENTPTDALEAMQPHAAWDAETSANLALAIDVEIVSRWFRQREGQARLARFAA